MTSRNDMFYRLVKSAMAFVLLVTLGHLSAQDKISLRKQVEELLRGLEGETLVERSRAERQLLELGPDVLSLLPPPELIDGVSAREAIRRIRPRLERRAATESSAASLISLRGEFTLADILEQLALQTRNRVLLNKTLESMKPRKFTIGWERTRFWNSVDQLCQQTDLQWDFAKNDSAIELGPRVPARSANLAVQVSGPFRLAITGIEVREVVGDATQKLLRINGRLSIEPRLRPLFVSLNASDLSASVVAATASKHQQLFPWSPEAKVEIPVSDAGREVPVQWDFRLPAGIEPKSLDIRGKIRCEIAAATERVVFDQKSQARGTIRRRGGVTVRLREVAFEPADANSLNAAIGVTVSYDVGGPAFESHRSWMFHNAVYLETKDGTRTNFTDFDTAQQADGAVAVDYRWQKIASPATQYLFVYEAPTLLIDLPVEIELEGLPFPQ